MCEEGEAAGERSAGDHAQNSLFSAEKEDTLKSVTGQLEYSRGNESNAQDEYFFFSDESQTWISNWSCKSEG